jgi:hypothetical protein
VKLSEFEFSRFSPRTAWAGLAVVGLVVALFFIPELISLQKSVTGSKRTAEKIDRQAAVDEVELGLADLQPIDVEEVAAPAVERSVLKEDQAAPDDNQDDTRASLSRSSLDGIAEEMNQAESATAPPSKEKRGVTPDGKKVVRASSGGLLSRWKLRSASPGAKVHTLDNLLGKDQQRFFERGRGDIEKFVRRVGMLDPKLEELMIQLSAIVDFVAQSGGGQPFDEKEVRAELVGTSNNVLLRMKATGFDRGSILGWQEIPVIAAISSAEGAVRLKSFEIPFLPKIVLRNVDARQASGVGRSAAPRFNAEMAVYGSDVDRVELYHNGMKERSFPMGNPGPDGSRPLRISGESSGSWMVVAYDKFGGPKYQKVYSFYPRLRRFYKNPDGSYRIAFRQPTGPYTLDRFFAVAHSKRVTRDPAIGVF